MAQPEPSDLSSPAGSVPSRAPSWAAVVWYGLKSFPSLNLSGFGALAVGDERPQDQIRLHRKIVT